MALLESYVDKPAAKLPDDMVIYRYAADTLQSWRNQFTVMNDNISQSVLVQRLVNPMIDLRSPLSELTDDTSFCNFGPKWYLVKAWTEGNVRTIIGLEIINPSSGRIYNSVNRRLRIGNRFTIKPLNYSGGSAVSYGDAPRFKVLCENFSAGSSTSAPLVWLSFAFFLAAAMIYVATKRKLASAALSAGCVLTATVVMFLWGHSVRTVLSIFSPTLYAGSRFLYSLGAVLLVNMALLLGVLSFYLARADVMRKIRSTMSMTLASSLALALIALIAVYTHLSLRSIIFDSGIGLELYKFNSLSVYTAAVYLSYLGMLMTVPMVLQMIQPVISKLCGRHVDMFSQSGRFVWAVTVSAYLVTVCALGGFDKEEDRVAVWANRLAVDRDISLEMQLLRAGQQISSDVIISTLAMMANPESAIRNRVMDSYLASISQEYKISVKVIRDATMSREDAEMLDMRMRDSEPVADGSPFLCVSTPEGRVTYSGLFLFYNERSGIVRLLLNVEQKTGIGEKGYARLLNLQQPGRVSLPSEYSYARYRGRELMSFGGSYPYQTRMDDALRDAVYRGRPCHIYSGTHVHFVDFVGDDEVVLVSRPRFGVTDFVVASALLTFIAYLLILPFTIGRRRRLLFTSRYFKTRISWVLLVSLLLTLVSMASVSVLFVYRRNDASLKSLMTDKIISIQALVQNGIREYRDPLGKQELSNVLEMVAENTKTDVSFYSTDGRILMSTTPEVFDRMMLGCRLDENAYNAIVRQHRRFFIQREHIDRTSYYCMYAPLMRSDGSTMGILCSPYTDRRYDFERDAVMHSMVILTLFLILLFIAKFMTSAVIDRLFKPLSEMGRKMSSGGLGSLEYIRYDRDDEISSLVEAYNRMVSELADSTVKLAQAERDKAWSGMARQVAHEIKNPLTPMKLQIQRLIRLKARGDESWRDKFDDVSKLLLDHIDILTQTANEFSTFAKLYSEDHTRIDLDRVLQEEISMFDNKGGVTFEYFGLKDSFVMAPKPQLTRVFVNLINNAVQALEDREDAVVRVSLRNSTRDGYYDIVFEDNGPGVAVENIDKLFSPNFTTKNSGSGLGLAISRSILEKCDAAIAYSRSFQLGGACFTVTYPK